MKANKSLSVNLVNENILTAADYVGLKSVRKTDKSGVFPYHMGVLPGAPLLDDAYVSMECELVHSFEYEGIDEFVLKVSHTYVEESVRTRRAALTF